MSIVVVATIPTKPGRRDEAAEAFAAVIDGVHAEDGCKRYALHTGDDELVVIEHWASEDALGAHMEGSAMAAIGSGLQGLVAGPPVIVKLAPHPAGGAKGAI